MARSLLRTVPAVMAECAESIPRADDYIIVNGFRFVKPYHFDFSCSVKQRWAGQTLLEVFSKEFPARSRAYYRQAIADGRLRLEGPQRASTHLSPDTILQPGQRMRHLVHRHEPPTLAGAVAVVGETPEIVAVSKPAGMPVHASGQYRKNTVLGVLQALRPDLGALLPSHRLDKPVSGVLLFARSPRAADDLRLRIEAHSVEKVYVARVQGIFPETPEPLVVDVALAWDQQRNHVLACPAGNGTAEIGMRPGAAGAASPGAQDAAQESAAGRGEGAVGGDGPTPEGTCPLLSSPVTSRAVERHAFRAQRREKAQTKRAKQAALREAAAEFAASGQVHPPKPAKTEFRRLAVAPDGSTSLVECRPRTGRTHQIRVHLQYLGHPIANDGQYGGTHGGPLASRLIAAAMGVSWDQLRDKAGIARWGETGDTAADPEISSPVLKRLRCGDAPHPCVEKEAALRVPTTPSSALPVQGSSHEQTYAQNRAFRANEEYKAPPETLDPDCPHCPFLAPVDYPLDLRPLWLHAREYTCNDWTFRAPLPDWAGEAFTSPPDSGIQSPVC